jgi:hypothetical protein
MVVSESTLSSKIGTVSVPAVLKSSVGHCRRQPWTFGRIDCGSRVFAFIGDAGFERPAFRITESNRDGDQVGAVRSTTPLTARGVHAVS